jgi:hypothetical protein
VARRAVSLGEAIGTRTGGVKPNPQTPLGAVRNLADGGAMCRGARREETT